MRPVSGVAASRDSHRGVVPASFFAVVPAESGPMNRALPEASGNPSASSGLIPE